MSSLKVVFLCLALIISPFYTTSFPDALPGYVTKECWDRARTFKISKGMKIPLAYDSAQICMYQNLQVLEVMRSLQLALTTPHTGRSICRMEVLWFNDTAERVNMKIYDTDLKGQCIARDGAVIVKARRDWRTKQISELEMPRTIGNARGRAVPRTLRKYARLLFTEYKTCLILITSFDGDKYCELFVVPNATINMHDTPCHSIYRIYCGYGRPTRGVWPNPVLSTSDDLFLQEAHKLRLLIERRDPLKEDTVFMNEFQMISEVLYHIPEANVYASTPEEAREQKAVWNRNLQGIS
uniref:Putative secreted protein n=1 Tax=Ixodes ricinus TaxID=34613 RepID=A0A147BX86_IXORI